MRTYTLLFSIAAHVIVVLAVLGITLTATDVLPVARRASELIVVKAGAPKASAARARRSATQSPPLPTVASNAVPLVTPDGIRPETGLETLADPAAAVDGLVTGVPGGDAAAIDIPPPPPPPPAPLPPVRVGSGIRPPQKVHHVAPIYPAIAQSARVSGVVILDAVIKEDGSVTDVRVLRSIPLLDHAAIDAVRQWRFTPTLLNGRAVAVVMTVTVAFSM